MSNPVRKKNALLRGYPVRQQSGGGLTPPDNAIAAARFSLRQSPTAQERHIPMPFLDSSQTLCDFFEEKFLPQLLQDAPAMKAKRFRNAIGRASLLLGHPATLGDLVDPHFAKSFVEHLIEKGFTVNRAEAFAACLRQVRDAARQQRESQSKQAKAKKSKKAKSKCEAFTYQRPNVVEQVVLFVQDHPRSISGALASIMEADDQVCAGQL